MSADAASAPTRTAPLALWRAAEAMLGVLYNLFGAPEDVAARHTLVAAAHALMAGWLRCAEAMLRRLILIEASAYPKPNTRPLLHAKRTRVRKLLGFDADAPEKWRVSFRCFGALRLRQAQTDANGTSSATLCVALSLSKRKPRKRISREDRWCFENFKPVTFRSAWPLAERYEALIRVFNDPAPYARRLSRRLHATPHRLPEVLRAPPEAVWRVDLFDDAGEAGAKAWAPRFSSG
jgi:hypothetical protein